MALAVTEVPHLLEGLPAGAWVAISEEESRVISYGPELPEVMQSALEQGNAHPLIARVPETSMALFF